LAKINKFGSVIAMLALGVVCKCHCAAAISQWCHCLSEACVKACSSHSEQSFWLQHCIKSKFCYCVNKSNSYKL